MSARPKARHVGKVCKCGRAYSDHTRPMIDRCMPRTNVFAPAPQEKGAEERTVLVVDDSNSTRKLMHRALEAMARQPAPVLVVPTCHPPATVALPLSLVERAATTLSEMDEQLSHIFWTSDDGEATRPGEPEDADGPKSRAAWTALRSVLAELRTYVGDGGKRGE